MIGTHADDDLLLLLRGLVPEKPDSGLRECDLFVVPVIVSAE